MQAAITGFPKPPLLAAVALIGFSVLAAGVGHLAGVSSPQPLTTPIAERLLRFEDRADGAVLVFDAARDPTDEGATPIAIATGENGFLRGSLRGFARTRHIAGVSAAAPFQLTAWRDGRLTLVDPATDRHADLEAFGPDNAAVYARFLPTPMRSASR